MSDKIDKKLEKLGLTIESTFVPWSKSRNAGEKYPSLNWKITLLKNGNKVLETDYMAGCAHCPSYKQMDNSYDQRQIILSECENGYRAKTFYSTGAIQSDKNHPILPKPADVIYSLLMDADVLDYNFSEWASNFGYDEDSRKAEKIYKDCQEIALKLIRGLGSEEIKSLQKLFQDYSR